MFFFDSDMSSARIHRCLIPFCAMSFVVYGFYRFQYVDYLASYNLLKRVEDDKNAKYYQLYYEIEQLKTSVLELEEKVSTEEENVGDRDC